MAKPGQPTKYRDEYAEQAYRQCFVYNATDDKLAQYFDVDVSTINNWKKAHPEFLESIKKGKDETNYDVTKSLYQRAVGFEFTEVRTEGIADPNNSAKIIGTKVTKTVKHIAPDVTAQIYWTKNRMPDAWGDKKVIEHENLPDVNIYLPENERDE